MKKIKEIYNNLIKKRIIKIQKRYRVVFSTLVLSIVFLLSTFAPSNKFFTFLIIFIFLTYLLVYFSILEEIEGVEWFMLFLVPIFTVIAFYVFYFLFPIRWLTRFPFLVLFAIGVYSNILTSNVLNVGVEKPLQLYRAAFSTNLFFHSLIVFLFSTVFFSMMRGPVFNFFVLLLLLLPLSLQFVWSIKLKLKIEKEDLKYAFILSIIPSQIALLFSFSPINAVAFGILTSAFYYYCAGYVYLVLEKKLFPETLREFNFVLILVIFFLLLSLKYG